MQLPDESPKHQGKILDHQDGIGEVDREEIEQRARELAEIDGLDANQVNEGHRYQARKELRGDEDANQANDDSGLEAGLIDADDVPGESGGAVSPATNAALHGDEQTVGEALVNEGIEEADHDRMTSSREEERRDQ